MTAMLSPDPFLIASSIRISSPLPRSTLSLRHFAMISVASWSWITSQRPSVAMRKNSSFWPTSTILNSGSEMTPFFL